MSTTKETIAAYSVPAQIERAPKILVIGGFSGDLASYGTVMAAYEAYANERENFLDVTFIPMANPSQEPLTFPPAGRAYEDGWTAWSLWQWLGTHAPDAVVIMGGDEYELAKALRNDLMGLGAVPVYQLDYENELISSLRGERVLQQSAAALEWSSRSERSATELADLLASTYGHELPQMLTYIQGMAMIGRIRHGQEADVQALLSPLLQPGSEPDISNSLQIAGHLVFAELAERTGDTRFLERIKQVADLGFDANGEPLRAMPFHGEYSDAFFMATPLLAKTGKLSGEDRYFDLILNHVNFLHEMLARPDGLYNHWPNAEAAWARGNAFVALGLAMALSDVPESHPAHARMLELYSAHIRSLLNYMDTDGMWHNVIDIPGSWAELSATAMIGTAIQRGVSRGWLEPFYQNVADQAWQAVLARTDDTGGFINVCESTPGQDSLDDYLNRQALTGHDDRAGGMMLMFATERLDYLQGK